MNYKCDCGVFVKEESLKDYYYVRLNNRILKKKICSLCYGFSTTELEQERLKERFNLKNGRNL